ncbi:hypothetical protein EIN_061080 [Entamoeba invadens IP1]|uniref:hypothetical protein n=1 Tax=Entamoeba invadens IP1 TaxID=370355 RepID=UPI0002C3E41E|nr:hypothetical protein EIN_061080 [Entamoeba invadens IP1]ELP93543.1 hypothetical protein EIN_061080 [Entamoeba invadens IP1]|eukprot:XP_004260314.1 hypothetical protein EIN_061080 [Entamoeba invadens IP1]
MNKEKANKIFDDMDLDKNGTIDVDEFVFGMKKMMGVDTFADNEFKAIFSMCDGCSLFHKKDGKLSRKEFARVAKAIPNRSSGYDALSEEEKEVSDKKRLGTFIFNIIDEDRSGNISLKELTKFVVALGKPKESAEKLMARVDKSKDKQISLDEFIDWYCGDL